MISKIITAILYIILGVLFCGIFAFLLLLGFFSDLMQDFANGFLRILFVFLICLAMIVPILFRKKLTKNFALPMVMIASLLFSVLVDGTVYMAAFRYVSVYTESKWERYTDLRSYMIDDLENKLQPIGKTKKEITDFLGEPANISQDENRLEYFIGYGLIDPYTYDIILENGIVVKTEIMQH